MSLKEVQEEDARVLKNYLVDKHLEGGHLPRKEQIGEDEMDKAPPLRHLWHHTKVLPKRPKTADYAKVYKKLLGMYHRDK
jgi:hypothetical protein